MHIKSRITINVDVSSKIQENIMFAKKNYIRNSSKYTCENGKSIIVDTVVICDEIIEVTKIFQRKLFQQNQLQQILTKKVTHKIESFHILLTFLLITILLMIIVSIYCYLIKKLIKTNTFITILLY